MDSIQKVFVGQTGELLRQMSCQRIACGRQDQVHVIHRSSYEPEYVEHGDPVEVVQVCDWLIKQEAASCGLSPGQVK